MNRVRTLRAVCFLCCVTVLIGCQEIVQNVPKLPKPLISPSGGKFTSNPEVEIDHIDPEVEIRYTLDGSDPTTADSLYSGDPLSFNYEDTVLKARAFKTGYMPSDAASASFLFIWRRLADMNYARAFHGTAVVNGIPYVYGGTNQAPEYYNPGTGTWTTFAALGNTRYGGVGAFAAWGDMLYAIGGYTNTRVAGVERWNPVSPDAWSAMNDLAVARQNAAATAVGDYIYMFGGATSADTYGTTTILRYAPAGDTWSTMASVLGSGRHYLAASAIGTKCYVSGGLSGSTYVNMASLEIYDTVAGSLTAGSDMPEPRCYHAMAAYKGKIYIFGGTHGSDHLTRVDVYDPSSNTWSSSPTVAPFARWCLAATPLTDGILVTGGKDATYASQKSAWLYVPEND